MAVKSQGVGVRIIMITSYKDLLVWQKSMDLVTEIYSLTEGFPKSKLYGIISQMRRAAVSIPCNIAEGRRRGTKKEFKQFLIIAFGSRSELETQIEICKRLSLGNKEDYIRIDSLLSETMKMLNSLISKLQPNS